MEFPYQYPYTKNYKDNAVCIIATKKNLHVLGELDISSFVLVHEPSQNVQDADLNIVFSNFRRDVVLHLYKYKLIIIIIIKSV